MKTPVLEVVRFENEDVIAGSIYVGGFNNQGYADGYVQSGATIKSAGQFNSGVSANRADDAALFAAAISELFDNNSPFNATLYANAEFGKTTVTVGTESVPAFLGVEGDYTGLSDVNGRYLFNGTDWVKQ